MTNAAFHEFFLAAAGVAGALIGLLFVAISVTPAAASGKPGHLHQQVRAAAAMSMFLDALVVSLLALIPGGQYLGNGSTALAIVGLTSTAALVITVARTPDPSRTAWQSTRTIMLFAAVLVVYGLQLASALRMNAATANTGQVTNQATLVIIMFLMGVTRAWEIVGAAKPRVLGVLAHELGPPTQPVTRESEAAVDSQPGATPIAASSSGMAASLRHLWTEVGGEPALVVAVAGVALVEPAPIGPVLGAADARDGAASRARNGGDDLPAE